MGKYGPAQKRAIEKYRSEKVERIEISVPFGKKAVYQKAATDSGKSLNRFIVDAVDSAILSVEDEFGNTDKET